MPSAFRLEALTIRLTRQDGNAAYAPWQVTLSGADGGSLELDGSSRRFAFAGKDLVALLNELFECRFFDMPATYDRRKVAQLNPDGTVSLIGNFTSNATGNGICVEVGRFEKCVRYGNEGPVELSRIFNRVFADAERLSGVR